MHVPPPLLRIRLPRRSPLLGLTCALSLLIAVPALAEYLGPDRTRLELVTVRDPDHDVWTLVNDDPPPGVLGVCLIIHTCDEHPGVVSYGPKCLWGSNPAEHSSCDRAYKEELQEITYPEATITADLLDCDPVDGWCTNTPTLQLTATEPVAGNVILQIEGVRNGEFFVCPGEFCGVPLLQGDNAFSFWALSTWGDSSQMGALSARVDSKGPRIRIPDAWKIWEPLEIQVEDDNGVDKVRLSIEGGPYDDRSYQWAGSVLPDDFIWDRYFGDIVAPIGEYVVSIKAWDALGNQRSASGLIIIPAPEPPELPPPEAAVPEADEVAAESETGTEIVSQADPSAAARGIPSEERTERRSEAVRVSAGDTRRLAKGGTMVQPFWGAAAVVLSFTATSIALSRKREREAHNEQVRRDFARSASDRSLEKRLASIWKGVQPIVAAISGRQRDQADSAAATKPTSESGLGSAAGDQATAARWQALADYYEHKAERDAAASAASHPQASTAVAQSAMALYHASERSATAPPAQAEPEVVLVAVPSLLSDPLGWAQASLINAGRRNETVGRVLTSTLSPAAEFVDAATPVMQEIAASVVSSIGSSITHTSYHARVALGWEQPPPGVNRWGASAETVFGLFNLASFGALGDIRYGAQEGDWLRVGGGVAGLVPVLGLARGGHVLLRGGWTAVRSAGTSIASRGVGDGLRQAAANGWDETLRFLRAAQAQDYARIAAVTERLIPGGTRATQLAAAALTHADELADFALSVREIERGVSSDNPLQTAMGVLFALASGPDILTNPLVRPRRAASAVAEAMDEFEPRLSAVDDALDIAPRKITDYPEGSPLRLSAAELADNPDAQRQLFEMAVDLRAEQEGLGEGILDDLGIEGDVYSRLKRESLEEFVEEIRRKATDHEYVQVGQMDDIARGRFDLERFDDVERVAFTLKDQARYRVVEFLEPRTIAGVPNGYPRYHAILQDPDTLLTFEWQIGTWQTTAVFETPGIEIPKALSNDISVGNLHDIGYKLFSEIDESYPALSAGLEIPDFTRQQAALAADAGMGTSSIDDLMPRIIELHSVASRILEALVEQRGAEFVRAVLK